MYANTAAMKYNSNITVDCVASVRQEALRFQKYHFIINPVSAAGKTCRRFDSVLERIKAHFGTQYSFSFTGAPHHATAITRQAILNGAEIVVAMGGDGTIQEVINGFFHDGQPINPACRLGIISSGSGQGLAQGLRLPKNLARQLEIIKGGDESALDLGRITYVAEGGLIQLGYSERHGLFVNEFQVGIGVEVVKAVERMGKRQGGFFAFGAAALAKGLTSPAHPICLRLDNGREICCPAIGVVAANGPFTGGGMKLAPRAKLNDGLLDILIIHQQSLLQRMWNFSKIYTGGHIHSNGFSYYRAKQIFLSAAQPLQTEADGELLNYLPCRIDILPAAIKVKTGSA